MRMKSNPAAILLAAILFLGVTIAFKLDPTLLPADFFESNFKSPPFGPPSSKDPHSHPHDHPHDHEQGRPKVELLYTSLCPFSREFIQSQFLPAFHSLSSHIDFYLIPYGNPNLFINSSNGELTVECQHGEEECELDRAQSCVLRIQVGVAIGLGELIIFLLFQLTVFLSHQFLPLLSLSLFSLSVFISFS